MNKTNKELAVEVAIAYIEASSKLKHGNGGSRELIPHSSVQNIIKTTHQTLVSLDN